MEIKNGIIIDGVLHEAVQYKINCKRCSLLSVCHEFNAVCAVIGCEAFVERGKVTVTSYYRETPKNAGEIIKNRKGGITMGFTTPCFIRKNTANIRNRLEEFGYYCNPYVGWRNLYYNLCTCIFGANMVYSLDDDDTDDLEKIDSLIDCGMNEELFLAIAALRDDTDKYQWFTDGNKWILCPEIKFSTYWVNDIDVNLDAIHKATVNELIEHFKEKE